MTLKCANQDIATRCSSLLVLRSHYAFRHAPASANPAARPCTQRPNLWRKRVNHPYARPQRECQESCTPFSWRTIRTRGTFSRDSFCTGAKALLFWLEQSASPTARSLTAKLAQPTIIARTHGSISATVFADFMASSESPLSIAINTRCLVHKLEKHDSSPDQPKVHLADRPSWYTRSTSDRYS